MATAAIGHNRPEPFVLFAEHIDELMEQAQQFLDGEPILTETQAEDVSRLLNMLRKASNDADDARKAEKKPHDDAAKAVQTKWKPLLDKADLAVSVAKRALTPWLEAKEAAQKAAAEAARQEAARQAQAARDAALRASEADLAGQTTVRVLQENAAEAEKRAARLEKQKAHAKGGERAISLRSSWTAEITNETEFARWAWANRREEVAAFFGELAAKEARHGPRNIPGLTISETRIAV